MTESTRQEVLTAFRSLTVWSRRSQRAPHKPLLCLLAISKVANENKRTLSFVEIESSLRKLLVEYGPPRRVCHPEYPFWALQSDGIWEFCPQTPVAKPASGFPTRASLLRSGAEAGFVGPIFQLLRNDAALRAQVVSILLEAHFPESLHDDIRQTLGLVEIMADGSRCGDRDPQFRDMILSGYEYRCAVCGFNIRIGHVTVALEAAHIMWHQAGGPSIRENGLCLCSLHHKLFDRGAFTVDVKHSVIVSGKAYGTDGFVQHLGRFHKTPLLPAQREAYKPKIEFLKWHADQVFLHPSRE